MLNVVEHTILPVVVNKVVGNNSLKKLLSRCFFFKHQGCVLIGGVCMGPLIPSKSKAESRKGIELLVAKFHDYQESGMARQLNEAQTRNEFVEPLFAFLGWDMRNLSTPNEVVTEYAVSKGRVDLAFNLHGETAFLLEAKSIKVNLYDPKWTMQAVNYSWNRAVNWAVLTDFQGLRILNAETPLSNLADSLFLDLSWDQYLDEFDKLWLLSRSSMESGALDKASKGWKKSLKTSSVSTSLFDSLAGWRELLSTDWLSASDLSQIEKDEAVQKFLDRLIFIRAAEDREISGKELSDIRRDKNPSTYWKRLQTLFQSFDRKFNSKLFAPHPLDQRPFSYEKVIEVLDGFYDAPDGYVYDFSAITADVLGGVYEKFLSLTQLPESDRTDKTKRKLRGIFYTPPQIVNYLLDNSLDEILGDGVNPREVTVLDPACGSGTFLVSTFERLVRARSQMDDTGLLDELEVVSENLFGVDIDPQATELAKLNLLLKCLKSDRQLPDLSRNVIEANSLLIPDLTSLGGGFGDLEVDDLPLDISRDFPKAHSHGGFDLIVGNPPYVFARNKSFTGAMKKHLAYNYSVAKYQLNTYSLFIERSFQLLRDGGYLAFIVPNTWLTIQAHSELRKFLAVNTQKLKIVNVMDKVFKEASVDVSLVLAKKGTGRSLEILELEDGLFSSRCQVDKQLIESGVPISISALSNPISLGILEKVAKKSRPLASLATVKSGLKAYEVGKGAPPQTREMKDLRVYHHDSAKSKNSRRYLQGRDVRRYGLQWSGEWLEYGPNLAAMRTPELFEGERVLVRQIPSKPPYCINAAYTNDDFVNDINSHIVTDFDGVSPSTVLTTINSKLASCWFVHYFDKLQRKTFPQFKANELELFPIPNLSKDQEKKLDDLGRQIDGLVQKQSQLVKGFSEHTLLSKRIAIAEAEVDKMLADYIELTDEEVQFLSTYHESKPHNH